MTIAFRAGETNEGELRRAIEALGYRVEVASNRVVSPPVRAAEALQLPEHAPAFLREAVARARAGSKPLVLEFGASWCAPCRKLKRETLESPLVAPLLARVEFLPIDLDAEPELGKFYGVSSIPCVLFVDSQGKVVDRRIGFEPPKEFQMRLRRLLP